MVIVLQSSTDAATMAQELASSADSIDVVDTARGSRIACTMRIPASARIQNGEFMPKPLDSASDQPSPDPNEKLVKVFDSEDESEALVVKGLLDSAGIDSDLMSASLVQDTFPGLGGMIILVREEDADAARKVIEEGRSSPNDETAEIEIIEEPPQKP